MCGKCGVAKFFDTGRREEKVYFGFMGESIRLKWIIDCCANCGAERKMRIANEN